MSNWIPTLEGRPGSRYRAIADALAADIDSGRLQPGFRLPTHRALAFALGVTIGTVTRAYAEAERRGLIGGEVGRGTFVRAPHNAGSPGKSSEPRFPFGMNAPAGGSEAAIMADGLRRLAASPRLASLVTYPAAYGAMAHRAAAARLLTSLGVPATPERTLLTAGAQNALGAALDLLARPGDMIATEQLTYPGFKSIARQHDLRLKGLPMDGAGLLPEPFAEAAAEGTIKALYCIPTLQNPTGTSWDTQRREDIASIARTHRIPIIEDDVYGFLAPDPPPSLASLLPEQVYHVNAVSKSLAPALRVGMLVVPPAVAERLGSPTWMAPPLMAELVRMWVEDGTTTQLIEEKRREGAIRQRLVRQILDAAGLTYLPAHPNSFHLWVGLPDPWRDDEAVAAAAREGISINPAWAFAVGRAEHDAIRLCFSMPADHSEMERGVTLLADILSRLPNAPSAII